MHACRLKQVVVVVWPMLAACWLLLALASPGNADPPGTRAEIPDPFLEIWDQAVAAMDQTYGGWQRHTDRTVDSSEFVIDYLSSIHPDSSGRLDPMLLMQVDKNRDRRISRDEALRFLEIQLGIRWESGDLLRLADGRVVDFAAFLALDQNRDSKLVADELTTDRERLAKLDRNGDGTLSLAEFASKHSPYVQDPIAQFRAADQNQDRYVDTIELAAATPAESRHLVDCNVAAFDENDDGRLSLTEYRVSMLGNFNYPWNAKPVDQNRDRRLSFAEFTFHPRNLFQLQRRFYFHRLDRDRDGELSPTEFPFETTPLYAIHRISIDGAQSVRIFSDDDYPLCGSPDVSPDGNWILFDAGQPNQTGSSTIRLMGINGQDARDICDGAMPTWSADGNRFACSRDEGGRGVWIMNADGSAERRIDDGWGAQWSPDGKLIAYANDNSLLIYDVAAQTSRPLIVKGSHPYRFIYWNMAWSPDSDRIVFKGKIDDDTSEVAIVDITDQPTVRQRYRSSQAMAEDFAWTAGGEAILLNLFSAQHQRRLIYSLNPDGRDDPVPFPLASSLLDWTSVCASRDGKWLVLATTSEQQLAVTGQ